jgi:hypothetical protein
VADAGGADRYGRRCFNRQRQDIGGNALTTLRATYQDGLHPLPEIDALIGLGDAARQADRFEEAAARYEAALELAAKGHYKFGLVRTLVSVGYLTLLSGSARQARRSAVPGSGCAARRRPRRASRTTP